MIYNVKILKPDKHGKLIKIKNISNKQASIMHWAGFNKDFHRTQMKGTTGVKYHRIGVKKQCAEEGCKVAVQDGRSVTCSRKCKLKRINRQKVTSVKKEGYSTLICKLCKTKFKAINDRKYCTNTCRYSQKRGIKLHGKSNRQF
jgi:hypothetical protein